MNPDSARNYNDHFNRHDPYNKAAPDPPFCSYIVGGSILAPEALVKTDYFEGVFAPSDIHDLLGIRVGARDGDDIYYCLYRPMGQRFTKTDESKATDLIRHLQRAHKIRHAARVGRSLGEDAVHPFGFTRSELRVLKEVMTGAAAREISERLGVTTNTVSWHLKNMFQKCSVHSRAELVAKFARLRLE